MSDQQSAEPTEPTEEDIFEQKAVRLAKRAKLIEQRDSLAGGAYPVTVAVTTTIGALRAEYGELEADTATGVTAGVAPCGNAP